MDVKALQQLHVVLWRQASLAYERLDFNKALNWYNYSLSLFPSHSKEDSNIAKLQVGYSLIPIVDGSEYLVVPKLDNY